jgi:hypothetical protein
MANVQFDDNVISQNSSSQFVPEFKYSPPILMRIGIVKTIQQNIVAYLIITVVLLFASVTIIYVRVPRSPEIEIIYREDIPKKERARMSEQMYNSLPSKFDVKK